MSAIAERLHDLNNRIAAACKASGRDPAEVYLLAVSKTRAASDVLTAIEAGQLHFGENYLQEALPKVTAVPGADWHFIGAVQSNKTKDIANNFNWVHSVASTKVARRLGQQRDPDREPLKVMIQVNQSGEDTKSGITPDQLEPLSEEIAEMTCISLQGLMTIPEPGLSEAEQRQRFAGLRRLRDETIERLGIPLPHLSMGMTADFPAAIMEGATWIRIGTAIFGPREPKIDPGVN